jgi:transcriptional regulator with GAF, ATPase, and Fis domain
MDNEEYPILLNLNESSPIALSGRIITVGSSSACKVVINNRAIPPRAAHLLFTQGTYQIQRLSQQFTIKVNGTPLKDTHTLHHGDTIDIGKTRYRYLERAEEESGERVLEKMDIVQELIDCVVDLLHNRSAAISSNLVAIVARLLRCDAARLVSKNKNGEFQTIARYPQHIGLDRFSTRAIGWAQEASKTVLMHDFDWKESEGSMSSLEKNEVSSVLCGPLAQNDTDIGYLYLDRLQTSPPFTENDRLFSDTLLPLFSEIIRIDRQRQRQQETIARLQDSSKDSSGSIVYESTVMAKTLSLAEKLARTESPVLIRGETGTGKELMAKFIHEHSQRADKPFLAINCGAIPENLIESELFGHEKGAFTGASSRKTGLFESAGGGTLMLDEIGDLPLALQVKLLRVLQESEIIRVGGNDTIGVDVRIIAVTNRNLEEEVKTGRFRQDLYYRLNVLMISMPPLRERERDIIILSDYFLKKYCLQFGMETKTIGASARSVLVSHSWPGNIRELDNCIQKAILYSTGATITKDDIHLDAGAMYGTSDTRVSATTLKEARQAAEKKIIIQTLKKTEGNVSLSAKLLHIDRKWLMKIMAEQKIDPNDFRN